MDSYRKSKAGRAAQRARKVQNLLLENNWLGQNKNQIAVALLSLLIILHGLWPLSPSSSAGMCGSTSGSCPSRSGRAAQRAAQRAAVYPIWPPSLAGWVCQGDTDDDWQPAEDLCHGGCIHMRSGHGEKVQEPLWLWGVLDARKMLPFTAFEFSGP